MTPTIFALFVGGAGLVTPRHAVLAVMMVCCLFGAAAAVTLPALGGASVTPAVLFLPFLVLHAMREQGFAQCMRQLAFPSAGFWLLLLVIWCMLAAFFLPRIFAGEVEVFTTHRDGANSGVAFLALRPFSGNVTQTGYAVGSVAVYVAARALIDAKGGLEQFRNAILLLASLNCVAAAINLAELYAGLPSVLEYVRNGSYAMLNDEEISGVARITGTFPEASAFSAFTLPLFAFSSSLWLHHIRPHYSGTVAVISILFLLFSTSTTAYVGLIAYLAWMGMAIAWGGIRHGAFPKAGSLAIWASVIVLSLAGVLLFYPSIATTVSQFLDTTVFNKLQSSSGVERSAMNMQAWSNFTETYGAGAGLGSVRASSYPLVLLSNVGAIGTLFFFAFIGRLFWAPSRPDADEQGRAVPVAARQAVIATLIAASVSAGSFDLGIAFYAFAAAASASSTPEQEESRTGARAHA
ncbi:MAG: hypothetical protein V4637_03540 [Pseudomonadota bacterium]